MADKRHDDGTTGLGRELPADVQDRTEQNAGYDAAADDDADDAFEDEDDELEDEDDSEEEDEEEA